MPLKEARQLFEELKEREPPKDYIPHIKVKPKITILAEE
jgi:hypothetical protein